MAKAAPLAVFPSSRPFESWTIAAVDDAEDDRVFTEPAAPPSESHEMLAALLRSIVILSLVLVPGCACRDCQPICRTVPATPMIDCEPTQPQAYLPDLPQLGTFELPKVVYCKLLEQDVQCTAANNSAIANLLAQEADAATIKGFCNADSALRQELLLLAAQHQRNEDAARTVELFYRLAEAEAGVWNLGLQLEQIDAGLKRITEMEDRGLLPPVSRLEITSQRLELEHQRIELSIVIDRLNVQLASMLNVELPPDTRFWPELNLAVDPTIPDPADAAMMAVGNRADLIALRVAVGTSGRDTLAASQLLLPGIASGLGGTSSAGNAMILHAAAVQSEAAIRGDQLAMILAEREKAVYEETVQAVSLVKARLMQIDLTRRRIDHRRQRVESLTQQRQRTPSIQVDLDKARSELLDAEQDLIHDILEWKIAVMKVKQSQGLLARECGC